MMILYSSHEICINRSDLLYKIVGLLVFSFSCKCPHFIVRKVGFPGLLELIENPVHLFPLPSNVKQILSSLSIG